MTENEIARIIVDACYRIHSGLGPGLLESVYEAVLARDLSARGLQVNVFLLFLGDCSTNME